MSINIFKIDELYKYSYSKIKRFVDINISQV